MCMHAISSTNFKDMIMEDVVLVDAEQLHSTLTDSLIVTGLQIFRSGK